MEVKDFPNYLIYPDGRVFSKNPRSNGFIKSHTSNQGYFFVTLYKDGKGKNKTIHRLVAEHYIPNPDNKPFVDHMNRDRKDNRIENLRWATKSENERNRTIKSNKQVPYLWISKSTEYSYKFTRVDCKRKFSPSIPKLLCYSFFYLLKYPIDK